MSLAWFRFRSDYPDSAKELEEELASLTARAEKAEAAVLAAQAQVLALQDQIKAAYLQGDNRARNFGFLKTTDELWQQSAIRASLGKEGA